MLKTSHEPAMKPPNRLCMAVRCLPLLLWSLARYCDLPATRLQPCPIRRTWKSHLGDLDSSRNKEEQVIEEHL